LAYDYLQVDVDLDMVDRKLAEAGQYQLDTDNQRQSTTIAANKRNNLWSMARATSC
jgi:hypothetical protein